MKRFVFERYRRTGGSPIGAQTRGGRYNPPGVPALYAALKRTTALAEFTRNIDDADVIGVASMMNLIVRLDRIIDVTNPALIRALGTTKTELTAGRIPRAPVPSQTIGAIAADLEIDGLRVWSAQYGNVKEIDVNFVGPIRDHTPLRLQAIVRWQHGTRSKPSRSDSAESLRDGAECRAVGCRREELRLQ